LCLPQRNSRKRIVGQESGFNLIKVKLFRGELGSVLKSGFRTRRAGPGDRGKARSSELVFSVRLTVGIFDTGSRDRIRPRGKRDCHISGPIGCACCRMSTRVEVDSNDDGREDRGGIHQVGPHMGSNLVAVKCVLITSRLSFPSKRKIGLMSFLIVLF